MVVFPKQICKRFLPDTGESRRDKTFFLKPNMELEVCTSLGSMFHRRGALFVKEIRPTNDAGWNGRKSPCCRPRVPCWCSWKLSFSRSNAGADCWWQRRMVVTSCRDQRWDERVSFKSLISSKAQYHMALQGFWLVLAIETDTWHVVRHHLGDEHLP